jgi:hypothetical protein
MRSRAVRAAKCKRLAAKNPNESCETTVRGHHFGECRLQVIKIINSASVQVRTIGLPQLGLRSAIILGVALAISTTPTLAEARVSVSLEAVTIEARDAKRSSRSSRL